MFLLQSALNFLIPKVSDISLESVPSCRQSGNMKTVLGKKYKIYEFLRGTDHFETTIFSAFGTVPVPSGIM